MAQQATSQHADNAGVRVPPPLLFVVPLLIAWLLQYLVPLPLLPTTVAQPLAILLLVAGVGLCAWGIGLFRRSKTSLIPVQPSTTLVISGPYRVTRNPMYLGMLCLYLAAALWMQLTWALLIAPIVIAIVQRIVIAKEERYLERQFGEAYRQYKSQVRRWM